MTNETTDYSATLHLPKTDFPLRAGLQRKEPELLEKWESGDLNGKLRKRGAGRPKFVLHDGPPYANGDLHIGHALNKVLKDIVVRSQRMLGKGAQYVPGWDCHGLPIEWKVEEEFRAAGLDKDNIPVVEFRRKCRESAEHWLDVQRKQFKRLGVGGDWDVHYTTMDFRSEATIAAELMKLAANGLLYRGSKPVMWSVVEKTALAEAEVEYEDRVDDAVWVAFPVRDVAPTAERPDELLSASVVAWTTTPWTLPANRALAYSHRAAYGLYRVVSAPEGNWARPGAIYALADTLAESVFSAAKVDGFERLRDLDPRDLVACAHPLAGLDYGFPVPLLAGDHVTEDAGTGFVHTAPGHGRDDYEVWTANRRQLAERGLDVRVPETVDADGFYTSEVPSFAGRRVMTDKGEKGDAEKAVIEALATAGALVARGHVKHSYPHSWRSKKPVIHRNTPQWFVAMDAPYAPASGGPETSLRAAALREVEATKWVPEAGRNRIAGMVSVRPDWVVSRQRAWGVPIAVFVRKGSHEPLVDARVNARIVAAFEDEGADAWFAEGASERFLAPDHDPADFDKVNDVLDVWFDSGSTHAFVLGDPERFPALAGLRRKRDGGADEVMYLEGSDQHRGWFQSSLLESCATRGRAPFDTVLTHGFVLDERGRKMSKSLGNVTSPLKVIEDLGADVLRMWVASSDYADDLRIGPEALRTASDAYRKLRNTIRWMLGALAHLRPEERVAKEDMHELDRWLMHRLSELDAQVRSAYAEFDFRRIVALLSQFAAVDLSSFYVDVRKDALYCDPASSQKRKSALTAIDAACGAMLKWLAPVLCFTAEEAWAEYRPGGDSVHLEDFPEGLDAWRDDALATKWREVRRVRSVVTGALEVERSAKRLGSPLESAPIVYVDDAALMAAMEGVDLAEVCIVSGLELISGAGPSDAFRLDAVPGISAVHSAAPGVKCARSWKYFDPATADPEFPGVTPRDASALREWKAATAMP